MTPLDSQEEAYMHKVKKDLLEVHDKDLRRRLARLAEFEAIEETKKRWAPYHELDAKLTQMYETKETIENAASYADQGEEECRAIGITPSHHATDELWECVWEIDDLITKTEKELEELNEKLEKEEEE